MQRLASSPSLLVSVWSLLDILSDFMNPAIVIEFHTSNIYIMTSTSLVQTEEIFQVAIPEDHEWKCEKNVVAFFQVFL